MHYKFPGSGSTVVHHISVKIHTGHSFPFSLPITASIALSVSLLIMDVLSNCDWKGNSLEDSWKALLNVSICLMLIWLPNTVWAKEHNSKWAEKQLIWQQQKQDKTKTAKKDDSKLLQTEQILPALPINKKTAIEQRRNPPLWRHIQN